MSVESLNRTLDQELLAVMRGASLECPVCGVFVLLRHGAVSCPECGLRLCDADAMESGPQLRLQAG
jgi:uncharacterized Zn finger protein (UPF0148 family)